MGVQQRLQELGFKASVCQSVMGQLSLMKATSPGPEQSSLEEVLRRDPYLALMDARGLTFK